MATPAPLPQRDTPFKKTARSGAAIAEVLAGRSGRECRHTPLRGVAPFRGPAPIPTSLLLSSPQCISCSQFDVKMFFSFTTNKQNFKAEQRCWDGVKNQFVRHLVSFLFHALTSLHPPSFHRNGFSTCCHLY